MKLLLSVLALGPLAFLLLPGAAPAPVALGPGAVIELHVQLFRALDKGDARAAAAFVDPSPTGGFADGHEGGLATPSLFLLDASGAPVLAHGAESVQKLLATQAEASKDGGPEWTTKILKSRADCHSADLSYAVFEFERSRGVKGGVQRFRSTSLVRHTKEGWKLMHWHVSPADAATAEIAKHDRR